MKSNNLISEFLLLNSIAVVGVSRNGKEPANHIFEKFQNEGYQVFAVNPNATQISGEKVFHDVLSIPENVEGVVIATHPDVTKSIIEQCAAKGVKYVWIHKSFGEGSYCEEAVKYAHLRHINVIESGCPLMYLNPDLVHTCMKWVLNKFNKTHEEETVTA